MQTHIRSGAISTRGKAGAGFSNGKELVPIRQTLEEMCYPQGPIPSQFNNLVAEGIMNDTVKQNMSKGMDIQFYWLRDRARQKQIHIYWKVGKLTLTDYPTKHHPVKHHIQVRPTYVNNNMSLFSKAHTATMVCSYLWQKYVQLSYA